MAFLDETGLQTLWTKIKNTFALTTHSHGNISSDGKVGTVATKPLITSTGGIVTSGSFGTTAGTFCEGNDTRVVNAITSASASTIASAAASAVISAGGYIKTVTSAAVISALGYTPPQSDTNTTYTGASGVTLTGTTFSHTTGAGWNHIPASGSTGQLLGYSAAGIAKWVDPPTGGITSAQAVSAVSAAGYVTSTYVSGATVISAGTATNATNVTGTAGTSTLSWNTEVTLYTVGGNAIKAKLPANPNTNTTYTFDTGDANGQIKVTPSGGTAQNVSVKGLGTAAYTSTGAFASATHTHNYLPLTGGTITGALNIYPDTAYTVGTATGLLNVRYKNAAGTVNCATNVIDIIGTDSTDGYNVPLSIGSHNGTTQVGAGESRRGFLGTRSLYNNENLYLTADGSVNIFTNCANDNATYAGPVTFTGTASASGGKINATGLGTVTATTFSGALVGNATTATSATYWGSEQNDISTNNTSATWVLVDQGGKCQHMLRANMVVGSATTAGSCTGNAATATTAASCTGNAATASKIGTATVGGVARPVYISAGVPTQISYTISKSVPADAEFTDTVYTHPTTAGNKHIPSGGAANNVLVYSAAGTAKWAASVNSATHATSAGIATTCANVSIQRFGSGTAVTLPASGTWTFVTWQPNNKIGKYGTSAGGTTLYTSGNVTENYYYVLAIRKT